VLTVSEVAQRVGISHMGRFSVYYRQRFGESPTRTLSRWAGSRWTRGEVQ
jgi:transcriptional regulator GlxA family with amidase domain